MRWVLIILGVGVLLVVLLFAGLMLSLALEGRREGKRERKHRESLSEDELFVLDVKKDIKGYLNADVYEMATENLPDDFFLKARDRVRTGLDGEPTEQRRFVKQLTQELAKREELGLNRVEVAIETDLLLHAYGHALLPSGPELLQLYREENDRHDKPQVSRDFRAISCYRGLVFSKYDVEAVSPFLDRIDYAVFLPIRDDILDALRLSKQGEGVRDALEMLNSQYEHAWLVRDAAAQLKTFVTWAIFRCVIKEYQPDFLEQFESESRELLGNHFTVPDSIYTGAKRFTRDDMKRFGIT